MALHPCRWARGSTQHTTPAFASSSKFVTVTHPLHPLHGQQVEVVRVRRGADPDLIVRLPDGRHAALALSLTDVGSPCPTMGPGMTLPLLDGDGLRRLAALIAQRAPAQAAGVEAASVLPCQEGR